MPRNLDSTKNFISRKSMYEKLENKKKKNFYLKVYNFLPVEGHEYQSVDGDWGGYHYHILYNPSGKKMNVIW